MGSVSVLPEVRVRDVQTLTVGVERGANVREQAGGPDRTSGTVERAESRCVMIEAVGVKGQKCLF